MRFIAGTTCIWKPFNVVLIIYTRFSTFLGVCSDIKVSWVVKQYLCVKQETFVFSFSFWNEYDIRQHLLISIYITHYWFVPVWQPTKMWHNDGQVYCGLYNAYTHHIRLQFILSTSHLFIWRNVTGCDCPQIRKPCKFRKQWAPLIAHPHSASRSPETRATWYASSSWISILKRQFPHSI